MNIIFAKTLNQLLKQEIWKNALYLKERKEAFVKEELYVLNENLYDYEKWMNKIGLDEDTFNFRLKDEGLNKEHLELDLSSIDINYLNNFEWYTTLTFIFSDKNQEQLLENELHSIKDIPFYTFYSPFLMYCKKLVTNYFEINNYIFADFQGVDSVFQLINKKLANSLFLISYKTLIYELNKNRLEKNLVGNSKEGRYIYFLDNFISRPIDILHFLSNYPVLARLMCEMTQKYTEGILESLSHFSKDKEDLMKFFQANYDEIINITFMGDIHNGKSVLYFLFKSGEKLLYKPHDLSMDKQFQEFLKWINKNGIKRPFKTLPILNKNGYGWEKFIEYKACENLEEIKSFYMRQGQLLAILYVLNGTDVHYENIIASGEYPYIIDLESIFHHSLVHSTKPTARNRALTELYDSVLKTGLLPVTLESIKGKSVIELSGLGGSSGQVVDGVYTLINIGTDEMKMVKTKKILEGAKNQPVLSNTVYEAKEFRNEIMEGFRDTYQLLLDNKNELLSKTGPISIFKHLINRTIIRNTRDYSFLLEASTHPKYLVSGLARECLFDHLWKITKYAPNKKYAINSETADLLRHDVPYFFSECSSAYLIDQRWRKITGLYSQDSFSSVIEKIKKLSIEDMEKQLKFISISLLTERELKSHIEQYQKENYESKSMVNSLALSNMSKKDFLDEAVKIGETIAEQAIWGEFGDISWINLEINALERLEYNVMEIDLYKGTLGVGLFFAYLARETNRNDFLEIAKSVFQTVMTEYHLGISRTGVPSSVFSGEGSIIYACLHFYHLWEDESIIDFAKKVMNDISQHVQSDEVYDLLGGCAGLIITCLDFYKETNYAPALEIAILAGDHLVSRSIKLKNGIGWLQNNRSGERPLGGFAHGSSGISLALYKLYYFTGKSIYNESAQQSILYENSLFSSEQQNWGDLRAYKEIKKMAFPVYWCHGASGIGLSRLKILEFIDNEALKKDLEIAVQTTMKKGFNNVSQSLCHGDLGNIDLLLSYSKRFNDFDMLTKTYQLASDMLHSVKEKGKWICGLPGKKQSLGLMLGLAGIGYELLRLSNPEIPSVLALESGFNIEKN